jgi:DNA-binding transcriptional MerR regulator/methanogenic corrinoid protein MtbC1
MPKTLRTEDNPRLYSIRSVCLQTGILPVTLRAWEARYRILKPARAKNRYRRYTEEDAALLRWIKQRVDAGAPIRLVAAEARALRRAGRRPAAAAIPEGRRTGADPSRSAAGLFAALTAHDESGAERCLADALRMFGPEDASLKVIAPCLWRIGDAWERGEVRIATEHFASTFLRGRLLAWFQAAPQTRRGPLVLIGCAPLEFHDIGGLMLACLLRRRRVRVEFLGQDLSLDDLRAYVREARPALVCLSAGAEEPARRLSGLEAAFRRFKPRPLFGFGGRAFTHNPVLQKAVPGVFLGETLPEAVVAIQRLLKTPA